MISPICVSIKSRTIVSFTNNHLFNYSWWKADFPYLIFIIGYWPFFEIAYFVYDMKNTKRQLIFTSTFALVIAISLTIFISLGLI